MNKHQTNENGMESIGKFMLVLNCLKFNNQVIVQAKLSMKQ
jgi:hypothetical protein